MLKCDWIVVFMDYATGEKHIFHNANEEVDEFVTRSDPEMVLCGFNCKHYDNHILKGVRLGFPPKALKTLNDWIIDGNEGWDFPALKGVPLSRIDSFDLIDDMQQGLGLKSIEGHMGLDITESSVPFDIDRPLTDGELNELVTYCIHDVEATAELLKLRTNYIRGKLDVGRMGNIPDTQALYCTNPKLTALFLGAKKQPHDDERRYTYPDNLLKEYIPQEVFEFFGRMYDDAVSDEDLFSSKLDIDVGGTPTVIGWGGIHAGIRNYAWETTEGERISNFDVASYYPSLMIVNHYASRNLPSFEKYKDIYEKRIAAKHSGDKTTANTLKLVLNATYGATLNQYNDLYDPLMARSVCISGQLYLLELAEHLLDECRTCQVVQLNTDGIMIRYEDEDRETVLTLTDEWQKRTGFGLEEDQIRKIVQKDVNNYVMLDSQGHEKAKGGYVVRGVAPAGAFKINNNAVVVADAVKLNLLYGTSAEETIRGRDRLLDFQFIAKCGSGYERVFYDRDGERVDVQRVNRVYATKDERCGTLYKVKRENGQIAKIAGLPEHCIVDNDNKCDRSVIDEQFYIEMARKQINDYLGIKETKARKKTMAATTVKKNLYEKLIEARVRFAESGVKKSGKNMYMKYKYFTLDDIMPVANRIFRDLGLVANISFPTDEAGRTVAQATLIDVAGDERMVFSVPMPELGKMEQLTPVQELGANITYIRRYLYMLILDITEVDITDEGIADKPEKTAQAAQAAQETHKEEPKPAAPPTPEKREEITKEVTAKDGAATPLQVKRLKKALNRLLENKPEYEEAIQGILDSTNNLEDITKEDCEAIMVKVGEMLEA